jgi:hypothetical protein
MPRRSKCILLGSAMLWRAHAQAPQLVFLGDSLTEMWTGDRHGKAFAPRAKLPEVFERHWGRWAAAAYGLSGDRIAHLHWRLLHGEMPRKPPKLVRPQ